MIIQGRIKWAKITGKPHPGYEAKFNEWSCDVYVSEDTEKKLKAEGLAHKIKNKGNGAYITFKRKELKADGTPNQPIRVVDHRGEPWNPNIKIGNDSVVNVNFMINEFGKGPKDKAANILSLQIWDLVKYEGGDGFPTREDQPNDDWASDAA